MGIIVSVYRNAEMSGDCTNGGPSSKVTRFCVTNVSGPFDPSADAPAAILEKGPLESVRLVPQSIKDSGRWYMFGGNCALTSDSRFSDTIEKLLGHRFYGAVKIHDRVEDRIQD
jgi:hypothetical protein